MSSGLYLVFALTPGVLCLALAFWARWRRGGG
jgi:hypothetical protein